MALVSLRIRFGKRICEVDGRRGCEAVVGAIKVCLLSRETGCFCVDAGCGCAENNNTDGMLQACLEEGSHRKEIEP